MTPLQICWLECGVERPAPDRGKDPEELQPARKQTRVPIAGPGRGDAECGCRSPTPPLPDLTHSCGRAAGSRPARPDAGIAPCGAGGTSPPRSSKTL